MGEEAPGGGTPFAGRDGEEEVRSGEAGGSRQVARVTSDMATGSDGGRGRTIRDIRGKASQISEAHSGRKGPPQEISEGRPCE